MTISPMEPRHALVADLAIRPFVRIPSDCSVENAARLLAATTAGTLVLDLVPVAELTERDIVAAIANGATPDTVVADVARAAPEFVGPETSVDEVAAIMFATGRGALVVVDAGCPLGVVELRDVAAALWGGISWLGALRIALRVEGMMR